MKSYIQKNQCIWCRWRTHYLNKCQNRHNLWKTVAELLKSLQSDADTPNQEQELRQILFAIVTQVENLFVNDESDELDALLNNSGSSHIEGGADDVDSITRPPMPPIRHITIDEEESDHSVQGNYWAG